MRRSGSMRSEHDVVIVGAGPAGLTLANLLGCYGVTVALLDREADVVEEPRAVGIDDEAIRTLQIFDMAEPVLENAVRNAPIRYYDSRGRILAHVAPSARPYGWPRRNLFFQPNLEKVLRRSLDRFASVTFAPATEAVELEQSPAGAVVRARCDGDLVEYAARYVVGADGGRSFVRREVGVDLLGDTAPMKWLVVDVANDTWDAPYSAVYTSSHRPSMTIPLPFGFRRFEFQVLDNEDPDDMTRPETVAELLTPFYPGGDVPPAARQRIYLHHSRTAAAFHRGRVFLVGDAAHLQPPFFGQGMNSGIRDVTNLAWKLAFVLRGYAAPGLLESYDVERREAAHRMVEFATGVGRLYRPANRLTEIIRNALFRGAQRIPGGRDYILQMKYKPVPRYTRGFVHLPDRQDKASLVGRAFHQPLVQLLTGERVRLDDVIGPRMAILSLKSGAADRLDRHLAERWAAIDGLIVEAHVTPSYRRLGQFDPATREPRRSADVVDVYDLDGGLRDLLLARPAEEVFVIRPDRYVAAATSLAQLDQTIASVLTMLDQNRENLGQSREEPGQGRAEASDPHGSAGGSS